MIYRRFGAVFSRVLLYKQDELSCLERDMRDLDDLDRSTPGWAVNLRSRDLDDNRPSETIPPGGKKRKDILHEMEVKVIEYGKNSTKF